MLFRILRALRHYPILFASLGAAAALLGWLASRVRQLENVGHAAEATGGGFITLLTVVWAVRWLAPAVSTGRWVGRRDDESEHAGGVATWLDVGERAGASAIRRRAAILRPSIAQLGRWSRRFVPLTEYAVPLLKTGWLPVGNRVWSSCEDVTVRFGGPRTGKTASLACHALDAPGALLVTTTRTDLLDLTGPTRARRGRVDVFNPTGLGHLESTVRWSPLVGCVDFATAQRRAADLIPPSTGEAERWDTQARGLLAVLMHAAALAGGSMRTVLGWVSPADVIARDQILAALDQSPTARTLGAEVRSVYATNERTLTSITATLLPAIRWLTETTAATVGDAPLDDSELLDVERLVAGGTDSVYLIGREGACRSLIGALTAEVAHQVRMTASALPFGRLDPPMTAILDEAPLTCGPIPLQDWTADMGGRGLTLHIAAQSPAQVRDVWGHDRANAILGNTGSLLVFGGLKAADDLDRLSTLCGTRLHQLDYDDRRPIPVMTPGEIAALPPGTALLVSNGLRPLVGRAPMIWNRHKTPHFAAARAAVERFRAWAEAVDARWADDLAASWADLKTTLRRAATREADAMARPDLHVVEDDDTSGYDAGDEPVEIVIGLVPHDDEHGGWSA
jgi:type IV secretion system protein VirD4